MNVKSATYCTKIFVAENQTAREEGIGIVGVVPKTYD